MDTMHLFEGPVQVGSDTLQFGIDVAAVIVGVVAAAIVFRINRRVGGRINEGLRYFIVGVLCNVLAIVSSFFSLHAMTIGGTVFDLHQNLMSLGMIFFIISTVKFSKLISNV